MFAFLCNLHLHLIIHLPWDEITLHGSRQLNLLDLYIKTIYMPKCELVI